MNLSLYAKEVKADWYEINNLTNDIMYMRVDSINRLETLDAELRAAITCLDEDFIALQDHPYVFLLSAENQDELVHASYIWEFCYDKLLGALAILDDQILDDQDMKERIYHNSSGTLHELVLMQWDSEILSYQERIPYRNLIANMSVFDIIADEFSIIINEIDMETPQIVKHWTIVFIICIGIIFSSAAAYLFISITRTVKPIQTLATMIKSIGEYDVSEEALETAVIRGEPDDEIFVISSGIHEMAAKLHHLYQQILIAEDEKRKSQLQVLQYQINPHFLNNTLGTIRMMATMNNQEEIAGCVYSLSRILRHTLVNTSYLVAFNVELGVLKHYVNIIQMRYKNRLQVTYAIEQGAETCYLPQQMLQPVVENAIMHGLSNKLNTAQSAPVLHIGASIYAGDLVIEIRDNGTGMTPETLKTILDYDPHTDGEKENGSVHIGLYNIHKRVKLFFGEAYGITVDSRHMVYTAVKIIIPCRREV
ncbi:MAG: histidine kinase [Spirochaetia bacterium]|nr:histidine kinase [Spirochaetia bacterium]